jgi:ubiquitin-like modifier-activating enzyme ATG7
MAENAQEEEGWVVPFVPFSSSIDSPFWLRYCREKLETIQLSEDPITLRATYGVEGPPRLQCHENAFATSPELANERVSVSVMLHGFNTVEAFQKCDKNQLIHDYFAPKFFQDNHKDLQALTCVLLCVYPELKSHRVLYWMGVPALLTAAGKSIRALNQVALSEAWTAQEVKQLAQNMDALRRSNLQNPTTYIISSLPPFFLVTKNACNNMTAESYASIRTDNNEDEIIFAFLDPLGPAPIQSQAPMGWPLRNMVAFLSYHLDLGGKTVKILSYRPTLVRRIVLDSERRTAPEDDIGDKSILLTIHVPTKTDYEWPTQNADGGASHKVLGWELNARNKPGPRWVNLRPLLDSNHLAIQAADLNLKLMKWRMIPMLKVDLLQKTKVLLIGAGTLGCSVARVLLGWGIRNMKIVDYGKVSYSNPVRQSLFTLEDCHFDNGSGRPKAAAAADALKTIAADVQSEGIVLSIPMPGHPESREAIEESVNSLDALVKEADAVFLLTDTRESRWLPTVMAAAHDKILINAALGLDSWLVMRHGGGSLHGTPRLGCYFCNDIVAPENSTKNRTLDQQCTVTRPGLAPIASSMAAELMVSLLHHPKRQAAPAPRPGVGAFSPTASNDDPSSSGPLGIIPHQIRGSLVSYTMMTPTVPAFKHCTACAPPVIDAYKENNLDVVFNACQSKDSMFLENTSGLTTFRAEAAAKIADMDEWDDDEGSM